MGAWSQAVAFCVVSVTRVCKPSRSLWTPGGRGCPSPGALLLCSPGETLPDTHTALLISVLLQAILNKHFNNNIDFLTEKKKKKSTGKKAEFFPETEPVTPPIFSLQKLELRNCYRDAFRSHGGCSIPFLITVLQWW